MRPIAMPTSSIQTGIAIGIADAAQMNCTTPNQRQNTVRLQMEVTPIASLAHVSKHNGVIVFGPSTYMLKTIFQYGAIRHRRQGDLAGSSTHTAQTEDFVTVEGGNLQGG